MDHVRGIRAPGTVVLLGATALSACLSLAAACIGPRASVSLPVALPDLSGADAAVQSQLRGEFESVMQQARTRSTPDDQLGRAYGELGMLLHAAEYLDVAETCYRNAQALMPADRRWPYYLGLLLTSRGDTVHASAAFARALELQPDEVPTQIRLARLHLAAGRPLDAEPLFSRALERAPRAVAALAGLAQVSLAASDYPRAIRYLEEALSIDPEAESLHAPLAMAYRGLGDVQKAEPHLRQWRSREIALDDPLKEELDVRLQSGMSYQLRGARALAAKDWPAAASLFREGLALAPANTTLRRSLLHKLGTALFLAGDAGAATEQFEEVVRLAPADGQDDPAAKAHYSLGVTLASRRQPREAVEHFSAAVRYLPNYLDARLALGDALVGSGRANEALPHYKEALAVNPRSWRARFGYALGLVRLHRFVEARDWLVAALQAQPGQPALAQALARVLAAAPDERARDGQQALALVQQLVATDKSTDLGETMAMALAETGHFQEAAGVQRGVMAAVGKAGLAADVRRMAVNLARYERGLPCRTPWPENAPMRAPATLPGGQQTIQ